MALRITQGMMHSQLLSNVNHNLQRMNVGQNVLATGLKINKPSDDPVGITYALRYRSELSNNEQYQKNVDAAHSFVDYTDTILSQLTDTLQRASEITNEGANGTNPQTAMDAIAAEMGTIYDQVVTIANDKYNGKSIFNGQLTDQAPYTSANAAYEQTDTQSINYTFAAGVTVPINVTGNEVFGDPNPAPPAAETNPDNLFSVLKGLQDAFSSGDQEKARGLMDQLSSRMDKILNVRSEVGARSNRIDLMANRLEDMNTNITSLDSKIEDADMAETITKLQEDQNVYQASLSVGAKIIQPSLMDYLR
ncbi:flagellar hook-associated protein 3 FlgL [Paenibacillus taihuensis]|uniref:Flagellar hook-associated protein 3 FlgL n=1 Tax=Paenibacillus taihuensis TaxID=1156355 RepID=A0A3D9RWX9_9BACL|nr:flagellar hook-associated protein FlgL [Paenibacillus taihuensis]REE84480.1 flagellar hook-associated protein 3 FlgL [Paenibacillus taihuensis]